MTELKFLGELTLTSMIHIDTQNWQKVALEHTAKTIANVQPARTIITFAFLLVHWFVKLNSQ